MLQTSTLRKKLEVDRQQRLSYPTDTMQAKLLFIQKLFERILVSPCVMITTIPHLLKISYATFRVEIVVKATFSPRFKVKLLVEKKCTHIGEGRNIHCCTHLIQCKIIIFQDNLTFPSFEIFSSTWQCYFDLLFCVYFDFYLMK